MKRDRPRRPIDHVRIPLDTWRVFLTRGSIRESARFAGRHGWGAPLIGVVVASLCRGSYNYLTDPTIVAQGHPLGNVSVLAINVLYSLFFVLLSWVLYFGSVTALGGLLNQEIHFSLSAFKLGGYLSVAFVPIFLIGVVIAFTIPASVAAVEPSSAANATDAARRTISAQLAIRSTPQASIVRILRTVGWLIVALFLVPAIAELYDIGRPRSFLAVVLPTIGIVTLTYIS